MRQSNLVPNRRPERLLGPRMSQAFSRLPAGLLAAGLTLGTVVQAADAARTPAEPFTVANINFETNASACDMGIQIIFDTGGITEGSVKDPNGRLSRGA